VPAVHVARTTANRSRELADPTQTGIARSTLRDP
jgi:hypothetical protein